MINRINFLLSFIAITNVCQCVFSQQATLPLKLQKPKLITVSKDGVQYVFSSPDGNYICYSSQDLNKIFIRDLKLKKVTNKLILDGSNVGYFPQWSADSKLLNLRCKNKKESTSRFQSLSYSIEKNMSTERILPITKAVNTPVVLNNSKGDYVYLNDKFMLEVYNELTRKTTVFDGTKSCYQLVLSPLGDKVAVHIGSNILVYSLDQKSAPINLGEGIVTSWSPDGKKLLGFKEQKNDGHQIGNTDIYAFDLDSQKATQLTFTKKINEMNPVWANDGKGIYFVNMQTAGIYFSKLK